MKKIEFLKLEQKFEKWFMLIAPVIIIIIGVLAVIDTISKT